MIGFKATRYSPAYMMFHCGWDSHVGLLPSFFSETDPRPAKEQVNERYAHGGGWRPYTGFTMAADRMTLLTSYEGDPNPRAVAEARLRDETIRLYEPGSWLAIIQPDGSFEVSRCD